jgi:hypothetical protein
MHPRHLENTAMKSQPRAAAMLLPLIACACVYLLAHEVRSLYRLGCQRDA